MLFNSKSLNLILLIVLIFFGDTIYSTTCAYFSDPSLASWQKSVTSQLLQQGVSVRGNGRYKMDLRSDMIAAHRTIR